MSDIEQAKDDLLRKIMILNDQIWEDRLPLSLVNRWLDNFTGRVADPAVEKLHALFWLSNFMYFGAREMRVLLRAMYRDLYLVPMIHQVRQTVGPVSDRILKPLVEEQIKRTRFLGVGNPSESGVHLLYYFRQENNLSRDLFSDGARVISRNGIGKTALREPDVNRYVFLDDVCGSGQTVIDYSDFANEIIALRPDVEVSYLCLFASASGIENARINSSFGTKCQAVYELDHSFRCLDAGSRYFGAAVPPLIDKNTACQVVRSYGDLIFPSCSTGWGDSQMLLGFHHNTPDNVPAIIWFDSAWDAQVTWCPAFKRYPKY